MSFTSFEEFSLAWSLPIRSEWQATESQESFCSHPNPTPHAEIIILHPHTQLLHMGSVGRMQVPGLQGEHFPHGTISPALGCHLQRPQQSMYGKFSFLVHRQRVPIPLGQESSSSGTVTLSRRELTHLLMTIHRPGR